MKVLRAASALKTPLVALTLGFLFSSSSLTPVFAQPQSNNATTPIQHVVVIFQENVSFDHYFGTYPNAANSTAGEPSFTARPGTPSINGLGAVLTAQHTDTTVGPDASPNNRNKNLTNTGTVQPFRLGRNQATTCDEDHNYTDEQAAYHAGQADLFVQKLGSSSANCAADKSTVMGYFDGNTVTAFWNYAQAFAMSDNSYDTIYGPSAPGAINLISGNTHGTTGSNSSATVPSNNQTTGAGETSTVTIAGTDSNGNTGGGSILGDPRPFGDDCNPSGSAETTLGTSHRNVGDLLNNANLSWGWFQGGFKPTNNSNSPAVCGSLHQAADGSVKVDYIAHHSPFQYFTSTANPHHLPPTSASMVGKTDQANHQYDLSDLFTVNSVSGPTSQTYQITGFKPGVSLPAVTYLKAPGFMDGHAQYSNPILEQQFVTDVVNTIMKSPYWLNTAIIIAYDDSDGWYDHVTPPLVNPSALSALASSSDALTGAGQCGVPANGAVMGRCGYGPRLPLLVISPYSKTNYVDHTLTDQSSILRFIEDNWNLGRIDASPLSVSQGGSYDQIAGSLLNMFDFTFPQHLIGFQLNRNTGTIQPGFTF